MTVRGDAGQKGFGLDRAADNLGERAHECAISTHVAAPRDILAPVWYCLTFLCLSSALTGCGFGLKPTSGAPSNNDEDDASSGYNLCGAPELERGEGTWDSPVKVASFPFVDRGDTSLSVQRSVDTWDCGELQRTGPEVVYRVKIPRDSTVHAELEAADGAALTLQWVQDRPDENGAVTGCAAVNGELIDTADLAPGTWFLVVDTAAPGGTEMPGAYSLLLDIETPDAWQEISLDEGLIWRRLAQDTEGDRQRVNLLEVAADLHAVRPRRHDACQRLADVAAVAEARAGLSLGVSDGSCQPLEFLRAEGTTLALNTWQDRERVIAWRNSGATFSVWADRDTDFTDAAHAFGGWPTLVSRDDAGTPFVEVVPAGAEPYWIERRSRAAAGFTAEGRLLLVTADGPGARSDGMTLEAWAAFLGGLGAVEAVNLDGDNANLWIDGCSTDGSVNWPVDGGGTTHRGARGVGSGLYVF